MTIQTTSSKAGPFIGNGSTTSFACNFPIDKPDDLQVIYTNALAQDTTLDPSQYTAAGFGDPAGVTITYPISGPPIGANEKLTLLRLVDYDQQTSITNQGGFYPTVIEKALDRIVMQCQQLAEKVGRAVSVSVSSNEDPNAAFQSIAINAAIAQEAANAAAESAAAAVASAASIEKPIPVASGGTGAETAEAARSNLGLGTAATKNVGTAADNVLVLDDQSKVPAVDASQMLWTGQLLGIIDITASGIYTKNPNASYIVVYVVGGGGGGGGAVGGASLNGIGGGGAGGGCAIKRIENSVVGATEIVTVGSGGNGATAGANNGATGGMSSFGNHCSATGGGGGGGGAGSIVNSAHGTGGTGIGGDINLIGDVGTASGIQQANNYSSTIGGHGAGPYGGPGAITPTGTTSAVTGNSAEANTGGGGAGGRTAYNNAASTAAGGNGGTGRVIVSEYR